MAYTPENNPYIPGDPYSYDLKWVVTNIKNLIANYTGQIDELKAFIMDYINSLDLSPIVAAQIQEMYDNGDFDAMLAQFITDNKVVLVDTDQSAIFTEAEKETGRKNLRAGGTNTNLLINSWFTVNQRGQNSYTGAGYSLDMWRSNDPNQNVVVDANGVTIDPDTNFGFQQKLDNSLSSALIGNTVTYSILLQDDTLGSITFTWPNANSALIGVINGIGTLYAGNTLGVALVHDATLSVRAIKLEYGSVSTLANDAPPCYAEELAKCQYYLHPVEGAGYCKLGIAVSATAIRVPIPCVLRAVPTITYTGSFTAIGEGTALPVASITVNNKGADAVELDCVVSGATNYGIYALTMTAGSKIFLSAEL